MFWTALILSLPAETATPRMRVWRALKAVGAAVLRDGVYVLPESPGCRETFAELAQEVRANGGTAWHVELSGEETEGLESLFDRAPQYREFISALAVTRKALTAETAAECARQARRHRKAFTLAGAIDYFPGTARAEAEAALLELEAAIARVQAPDEPNPQAVAIVRRDPANYRKRIWATRRRPKVDRLASAWLILRHIDSAASFVWLAKPADCPTNAVGFDFDGAEFSHVDELVTFEALLASFGLAEPALARMAAIVHALDVGGSRPPEADGVECMLEGTRMRIDDDTALLEAALVLFDGLAAAFSMEP